MCCESKKSFIIRRWDYFRRQTFVRESFLVFFILLNRFQPFARITTPRIWRNSRKLFSKASIMIRTAKYRGRSWRWSFWLWPKCPRMNNKFDKAPSRKAEFGANDASMASDPFLLSSTSLTSLLSHFEHAVKLHFKSLAYSTSRHENNRSVTFWVHRRLPHEDDIRSTGKCCLKLRTESILVRQAIQSSSPVPISRRAAGMSCELVWTARRKPKFWQHTHDTLLSTRGWLKNFCRSLTMFNIYFYASFLKQTEKSNEITNFWWKWHQKSIETKFIQIIIVRTYACCE